MKYGKIFHEVFFMLNKKDQITKAEYIVKSGLLRDIKRYKIIEGLKDYGIRISNYNYIETSALRDIYAILINNSLSNKDR